VSLPRLPRPFALFLFLLPSFLLPQPCCSSIY
jgi:hypothetical protein